MIKSQESRDLDLARKLYQQENCFGLTENAIIPKNKDKENYKPRTLIDQTLELIDPTPNIYTLFMQFNERFFWNVLLPVEVKWSSRMTSCAGVCSFHPRNRQCVISLSAPLLKLRPRKDLVETLLHEMIHGYLFLTNNNRDRDGHGPEFCKHMDRINKTAGTKITIYHSFHDEVKLYQQHWWRCDGPCQKRAPYFGTVRRAMNRAPGPTDFWWKEHQRTCGGQFIKIKEPENFKVRGPRNKDKANPTLKSNGSANSMANWLTKSTFNTVKSVTMSTAKNIKPSSNAQNSQNGLKKLGNSTNNVHGWGVGSPSSSNNLPKPVQSSKSPYIPKTKPPSNIQSPLNGLKKLGNGTNNVHGWGVRGPSSSNNLPKPVQSSKSPYIPKTIKPHSNIQSPSNGLKKLGNNTNNVYGWGTSGPNGSSSSNNSLKTTSVSTMPKLFCSGSLGGSNTGKSNLLDKFGNGNKQCNSNMTAKVPRKSVNKPVNNKIETSTGNDSSEKIKLIECPVCSNFISNSEINKHVNSCLMTTDKQSIDEANFTKIPVKEQNLSSSQKRKIDTDMSSNKQPKLDNSKIANCPVCNKSFSLDDINEHLDECLSESTVKDKTKNDSIISVSSESSDDLSSSIEESKVTDPVSKSQTNKIVETGSFKCLVCNVFIPPGTCLNDHLEDCIGSLFNDDSIDLTVCDNDKMSETISETSFDESDKYPCPVCMELISESLMNQHLDTCLKT
ncbi:DNA-dependent metalloprotease SPRTN [Nomia melanderi]|uniref:DNA-dependent metalloprotease SPRTN n=1 Tax=Nomia melanderi TaxID=2448451 RepID=UPI0013046BD0|nr:sprT-like domain-containing protein Spartan [Nomia melanderi]XP_031847053.1 sprT-like domain-containing protein Spartan [Nomia melanderi]